MKKFKKILAVFVALVVILSTTGNIPIIAIGNASLTLEEFMVQLSELLEDRAEYMEIVLTEEAETEEIANGESSGEGTTNGETEDEETASEIVNTNRLIVKTVSNSALPNDCNAVAKVEGYQNLHVLQYEDAVASASAFDYFDSLSYVEYVEYDNLISLANTVFPDPETRGQDMVGSPILNQTISGMNLPEVIVGVIDSGVDAYHIDFNEDPSNPRVLPGREPYDIIDKDPAGRKDSLGRDLCHGTHVAGIIIANTLSNVKVKPYNLFYNSFTIRFGPFQITLGPSAIQLRAAIDAQVEDGVDVINMSLGAKGTAQTVAEAIENAEAAGVTCVVAAGNNEEDANDYFPANVPPAITVSAVDSTHALASFSNYGSCVDIAAPGVNVYSTIKNNDHAYYSGTSMAAPFVAAAAATLKSLEPTLTPAAIQTILKETAEVPNGWNTNSSVDPYYGTGIVNFTNMYEYLYVKLAAKANSTTIIDHERKFIYGLKESVTKNELENIFLTVRNNGWFDVQGGTLGTGSTVTLYSYDDPNFEEVFGCYSKFLRARNDVNFTLYLSYLPVIQHV
ncbi:MAG: S8 family serine peptidase [Oscillospiraceae bacterium]|nr:S8 family serine peptidase [Oscillospiraceae bacterium]